MLSVPSSVFNSENFRLTKQNSIYKRTVIPFHWTMRLFAATVLIKDALDEFPEIHEVGNVGIFVLLNFEIYQSH